ncbi:hypothetical protein HCCG_01900 [Helicobacter cinaedi CCUG 18818 = ATCC BAA-847]|uniref:Uncharacterized protein n=1 Tax=Helicobacter cinaedi CCUG 18818 = ATCC BAA-847 TaxID=537971 RepID=A0ABN0BCR7_9HELI|nr:hypothetical protein HCCG_01900 [Helicobacter cinaedi CCUG 18818 = ATCC BAA-847]
MLPRYSIIPCFCHSRICILLIAHNINIINFANAKYSQEKTSNHYKTTP